MEYSSTLATLLNPLIDSQGFLLLDEATLHRIRSEEFEDLLDYMGQLSMKARELKTTVTQRKDKYKCQIKAEGALFFPITSSVKLTKQQVLYLYIK